MGVKEAITQLEIIATNMVGRLCEIPNEDERQIELLNKQIEALDMAIESLKAKGITTTGTIGDGRSVPPSWTTSASTKGE